MKPKVQPPKADGYEYDILSETNSVASATECTGLIQIPPTDFSEAEAYGDIYVIPEQINDFDKVKKPCGGSTHSARDFKK